MHQRLTALLILLAASPAFAEGGEGGGWGTIIFHAINLGLLLFIIVRFAGAKVKVGLESKAANVTRDIDEAQKLHAAARARLDEYEQRMAGLDTEIAEIKAQYHAQGVAEREKLLAEAKAEAERIRKDAERSAEQEFSRLAARLEAEVVDRAMDAAEQAIREKLTPADQRRLIADYLTQLEETTRS
ncbi:MAG: ATP synthase F0 subunit B [bacterium]